MLFALSRLRTGNVVFNYMYYNNKLQRTEGKLNLSYCSKAVACLMSYLAPLFIFTILLPISVFLWVVVPCAFDLRSDSMLSSFVL